MQAINGSAQRCQTCFFPTYPYVDAIDLAAYTPTDFSNQWVYFLGDVTVRQMYGEFAATVHRSQVGSTALLYPNASQVALSAQVPQHCGTDKFMSHLLGDLAVCSSKETCVMSAAVDESASNRSGAGRRAYLQHHMLKV